MRPANRLALAALAGPSLALGLGLLLAHRAVEEATERLLRADTAAAARLLREPGGAAAAEQLAPGRWRLGPALPGVDEAVVVAGPEGRRGRAAVYDESSWDVRGTLEMSGASQPPRPLGPLAVSLVAAVLLALGARAVAGGNGRGASALAVSAFVVALVGTGAWARSTLAAATAARIERAARAVSLAPPQVLAAPGGVHELTGLPFLLRDGGLQAGFTSFGPAAATALAQAPTPVPSRLRADGLDYAAVDVGAVRLAMIPFEHALDPSAALAGLGVTGLALAALPLSLLPLLARPRHLRRELVAWRFLAPALAHLAVFTAGPLAFAAWLSLHRYSLIDAGHPFVGLANYVALLADGSFRNAVFNTAVFTLHVPFSMALALGLALLARQPGPGVSLARAAFFLPGVTSLAAVAMVWQWMLHDEYGVVNAALGLVGLGPVRWMTSPQTALLALMIVATWISVGYQMVLFQAGLSAIPRELYDAARIDGAGPLARFRHVTLPGLRDTLFFVLVTSVIGSFQVFGTVYVMTEGGPLHSTDVAVYHVYEEAWEYFRFGSASAMSFTLFAIVFAVTWLHFRALERRA